GELGLAWAHLGRLMDLAERHPGNTDDARILKARMLLYQGDVSAAYEIAADIRRKRAAQEDGNRSLLPSEEALLRMIEGFAGDADDSEWDGVQQFAECVHYQQDPIEVVEMRGLAALRAGRREDARRHLEHAHRLAKQVPNLMEDRLARELREIVSGLGSDPAL